MNKKYIKIENKFHVYHVFHKNNKTKKNKTCHYKVFLYIFNNSNYSCSTDKIFENEFW